LEWREVQVTQASTRVLQVVVLAIAMTSGRVRGANDTSIDASLTIHADLPDAAQRALVREVESIWRDAGIQIRWVNAKGADPLRTLRVVVDRRPASPEPGGNWVVGELLRFDDGAAVAVASIARAEVVVHAAGTGPTHVAPDSLVQHRVGVVLGRAVAHEIGHYLLESGAHARHGLMRATFQPREFTDLRSGTFEVDEATRRLIQQRLRGGRL
jgi:hypothetical protein